MSTWEVEHGSTKGPNTESTGTCSLDAGMSNAGAKIKNGMDRNPTRQRLLISDSDEEGWQLIIACL